MVTKGWASTTSAFNRSTRWPVDHVCSTKADAATSPFNVRCDTLDVHSKGVPLQKVMDVMKNSQGEDFLDSLKGVNMVVVNGRDCRDAYTCVSGKRCSRLTRAARWLNTFW